MRIRRAFKIDHHHIADSVNQATNQIYTDYPQMGQLFAKLAISLAQENIIPDEIYDCGWLGKIAGRFFLKECIVLLQIHIDTYGRIKEIWLYVMPQNSPWKEFAYDPGWPYIPPLLPCTYEQFPLVYYKGKFFAPWLRVYVSSSQDLEKAAEIIDDYVSTARELMISRTPAEHYVRWPGITIQPDKGLMGIIGYTDYSEVNTKAYCLGGRFYTWSDQQRNYYCVPVFSDVVFRVSSPQIGKDAMICVPSTGLALYLYSSGQYKLKASVAYLIVAEKQLTVSVSDSILAKVAEVIHGDLRGMQELHFVESIRPFYRREIKPS